MPCLLQGYQKVSDAEAVELTVVDLRWQMVLERLGEEGPAFAQGTLVDFRNRMVRTDMDRRLLERTVALAKKTGEFDPKKLPKTLRIAIDSAPLEGAGRVEDTINLLWHAARKIVEGMVLLLKSDKETVCQQAGISLLLAASAKGALDRDWSQPGATQEALEQLTQQLEVLVSYPWECADPGGGRCGVSAARGSEASQDREAQSSLAHCRWHGQLQGPRYLRPEDDEPAPGQGGTPVGGAYVADPLD